MNKFELIKTELKKPEYLELVEAQNYPAIAVLLNQQPLKPNPKPQEKIPKPITLIDLFQQITPLEALEINKIPGMVDRLENVTEKNDRIKLQALFKTIQVLLGVDSQNKIQALMQQTILDPNYEAQIRVQSRAEELGIGLVTNEDIQACLILN